MFAYSTRLVAVLACLLMPLATSAQSASDNAEARAFFEEGNRLYQEANRASGNQRGKLLRQALQSYADSLRVVRSRNALFNAAITLEDLERYDEAYNYYTEYLVIGDLPPEDKREGKRRQDALRGKVAVLKTMSNPAGAMVWVDRKDLAARGTTPIELALPSGTRTVFLERKGYAPTKMRVTLRRGTEQVLNVDLEALPVALSVVLNTKGTVTVNGEEVGEGRRIETQATPGVSVIVATADGHDPVTREVKLKPGEPVEVSLSLMPIMTSGARDDGAKPRLRNASIGTAAATVATLSVALGVSIRARTLRDDYNAAADEYEMTGDPDALARANALSDKTDRFNLTADVFWGASIALGISSLVLFGVHKKKQRRERAQASAMVTRDGAFASVKFQLGAAQ